MGRPLGFLTVEVGDDDLRERTAFSGDAGEGAAHSPGPHHENLHAIGLSQPVLCGVVPQLSPIARTADRTLTQTSSDRRPSWDSRTERTRPAG